MTKIHPNSAQKQADATAMLGLSYPSKPDEGDPKKVTEDRGQEGKEAGSEPPKQNAPEPEPPKQKEAEPEQQGQKRSRARASQGSAQRDR